MRKFVALVFHLLVSFLTIQAQQIDACENPESFVLTGVCGSACVLCDLDGFSTSNTNPDAGIAPAEFCATQDHNIQWVGFVAGSEDITLEVSVFNCSGVDEDNNMISDGLQMGVYNTTNCTDFSESMTCIAQIEEDNSGVFTNTEPLIVGGIYYLVVDGFNGDICEFSIDVTSGSTMAPTVDQVVPQISTSALFNTICPSGTLTATVDPLIAGAGAYLWTLDGVEVGTDASSMFQVPNFETTMELCVTAYNPCSQGLSNCIDIIVENLEDIIYDVTICEGESYFWEPNGVTYTNSIVNVVNLTTNDCAQLHQLILTVQDPVVTSINATICDDESYTITDPYTSDETVFNTSGDYTVMLTDQFDCDSIVELDLTVLPTTSSSVSLTICPGDSYTVANADGSVVEVVSSPVTNMQYATVGSNGCTETLTLTLMIESVPGPVVENITICAGESHLFNGTNYSSAGTFNTTFTTNPLGCEYPGTLNLSVHTPESSVSDLICEGDEVIVGGQSFTQSGNFTVTIPGGSYLGCDSTIMLDLTVEPSSEEDQFEEICDGESFILAGQAFTQTGDYEVVVGMGTLCDEIVNLHLEVNPTYEVDTEAEFCFGGFLEFGFDFFDQPGLYVLNYQTEAGCDSIVNLNVTMTEEIFEIQSPTICDNETYEVGNQSFDATGSYEVILEAADGCDSIIAVVLTVVPTYTVTVDETICPGDSYLFDGSTLTSSGMYMATLQATNSCDSVVTLNLTVAPPVEETVNAQICSGQSYTVGTETFSATGNYDITITESGSCDSTVHLNLTVTDVLEEDLAVEICNNQSYMVGMETFSVGGNYDIMLTSTGGCDSVVHLALTVSDVLLEFATATICEGDTLFVDTSPLTTTGVYPFDYVTSDGCDSTYQMTLTVLPDAFNTINPVICSGTTFEAGGMTYDTAGVYNLTLQAANGCDSFLTVNLTVDDILFFAESQDICDGQSVTVDGTTLDATGVYEFPYTTAEGCDSLYELTLTVLPAITETITPTICEGSSFMAGDSTFTTAGTYTVPLIAVAGCDSILTVDLSITNTVFTMQQATICEGDTVYIDAMPYTTSGMYEELFLTPEGCDSIVQLDLTVNPNASETLNPVICDDATFEAGGQTFNTTGVHQVIIPAANGCDSTITINLTVHPTYNITLNPGICTGQTFEAGGQIFDQTGVYQVALQTAELCDSIININLTVSTVIIETGAMTICEGDSVIIGTSVYNTTGNYEDDFVTDDGCDSLFQLDLTVLPTTFSTISPLICAGETFDIGTSSFNQTGTYEETILSAVGCDSVVTINLTVAPNPTTILAASICDGGSYTVGDSTLTSAGTYVIGLTSILGCDSTVTVDITIADFYESDLPMSICEGESVTFDGMEYMTTGIYSATFLAQDGCDSIVHLDLTVNPLLFEDVEAVICEGETFSIAGVAYSTTGIHQEIIPSIFTGCDSTITLDLTVNPVYMIDLADTICEGESVMIGNMTYMETGVFTTMMTSVDNCDSTVVLDLTVLPILTTDLVQEICDGETAEVGSSVYTISGQYTDILTSVVTGCDSIVNLDLTVIPIAETMLVEEICDGEIFTVGTTSFDVSGQYTVMLSSVVTNCDSIVMLDLTVHPTAETMLMETICSDEIFTVGTETFDTAGDYTVNLLTSEGCDSTVLLNLTVIPCTLGFTSTSLAAACNGSATGSFEFTMTIGTAPYTFNWVAQNTGANDSGIIDANGDVITFGNLLADTYTITVTDANGYMTDFMETIGEPLPMALSFDTSTYGNFNTSCPENEDGSVTAIATNGTAPYTYQWSNNTGNQTAQNLAAGTYAVTATDNNGCEIIGQVSLTAPPEVLASIATVDPLCFGDQTGVISIENASGGQGPYLYAIDGGAFTANPVFGSLNPGTYDIEVQDANGCAWADEAQIMAREELLVDLGEDLELQFGDSISIHAQTSYPVMTYQWKGERIFPCAGSDTTNCARPYIAPLQSGTYSVTVTDENGCQAEDQIQVIVKKPRDVFIPTAFSPNGDGFNDLLLIQAGNNVRQIKSFTIFNRWGELLHEVKGFSPNNPAAGWDGTHRGQLMNAGVYVYFAEVEYIDGETLIFSGDFVLLR